MASDLFHSKTINDLCREAYETAKQNGWHEEKREFGTLIALMHSELSEALEAYRKDSEEVMWSISPRNSPMFAYAFLMLAGNIILTWLPPSRTRTRQEDINTAEGEYSITQQPFGRS